MLVIWDEPKRTANLLKHRIDFADFEKGFDFDTAVEFPAKPSRTGRARFGLIGELNGEIIVVAVFSPLGSEALSLVSARPASRKERDRYGF